MHMCYIKSTELWNLCQYSFFFSHYLSLFMALGALCLLFLIHRSSISYVKIFILRYVIISDQKYRVSMYGKFHCTYFVLGSRVQKTLLHVYVSHLRCLMFQPGPCNLPSLRRVSGVGGLRTRALVTVFFTRQIQLPTSDAWTLEI